ncbi:RNA-binding domain-containing protein [Ascobolus immersus RN42]|uniref:RNA-binding domain-containing protein n=1 Tax=Ascobolus immersus RN42 TaxID=1160509 RepID=A0A3N4I6C6_ASCIM|nr:RNA-binding domain-containing protein [Ascobolus immersus RN42]
MRLQLGSPKTATPRDHKTWRNLPEATLEAAILASPTPTRNFTISSSPPTPPKPITNITKKNPPFTFPLPAKRLNATPGPAPPTLPAGPPPNQTLYVSNLPSKKPPKPQLRTLLYTLFSTYGPVLDVVALRTSKMRGQAHIVFRDIAAATQAMRALNGVNFLGNDLKITYAKGRSNVISHLLGTYIPPSKPLAEQPKTAFVALPGSAPTAPPTVPAGPPPSLPTIPTGPPPSLPAPPTAPPVASPPSSGLPQTAGVKRPREEDDEDEEDEGEMEMDED